MRGAYDSGDKNGALRFGLGLKGVSGLVQGP